MTLKLCSIAAALALAVGVTAAPLAQAQSTMSKDANKAAAPTGDRSADRKVKNAEEDRIEADYNAAKEKCDDLKGNEKSACEKQAKAKHEQAQADIKKQYAQKDAKSSATSGSTSK